MNGPGSTATQGPTAPAPTRESTAPPAADETAPPASSAVTETSPPVAAGDACALITDEEASAVLGTPITRNEEGGGGIPELEGGGCIKGNERQAGEDLANVALVSYAWFRGPGEEISAFFDDASALEDAVPVSEVGERAVFSASGGFLIAVRGDTAFTMQVSKFGVRGTQEEVVGLARLLIERAPT